MYFEKYVHNHTSVGTILQKDTCSLEVMIVNATSAEEAFGKAHDEVKKRLKNYVLANKVVVEIPKITRKKAE